MGGGLEIGTVIYSVHAAELDGQKIWRFRDRTFVGWSPDGQSRRCPLRRFAADQEHMEYRRRQQVTTSEYQPGKIVVTTKARGKETTRTSRDRSAAL